MTIQAVSLDAIRKRIKARQQFSWQDLLIMIECQSPRKVAYLAETLGIPKPSITRAVDNLAGFATPFLARTVDGDDRRSPFIETTNAGKKFLQQMIIEIP